MAGTIALRTALHAILAAGVLLAGSYIFREHPPTVLHWILLAFVLALLSALVWVPPLRRLQQSTATLERSTTVLTRRLNEIQKSQKRFLGDAAHELNAPIARIQFALGLIEETLGEEHHADVKALHDEVQEMSALVNELLYFSKVGMESAGAAPLAAVYLRSAVQRASDRENIPVDIAVDPGLCALAHEVYLTRAVANLLRNARRYAGHAGPIEVRAGHNAGFVELIVADHGPGLPESELEQIFDPFYRLDPSRTTTSGGKGLGLAIVRSCVDLCRGKVFCRNRKPKGLEVVIRLTPRLD